MTGPKLTTPPTHGSWLQRARWFIVHRLLHADDSPRRIARGVALGLFIALTPTFGIQIFAYFPIAYLLRANRAAGFPFLWITNALTLVPIYFPCYYLGAKLLAMDPFALRDELTQVEGTWLERMQYFWELSLRHAAPLWLGCMIVAVIVAGAGYLATTWLVTRYRLRKWGSVIVPTRSLQPAPVADDRRSNP